PHKRRGKEASTAAFMMQAAYEYDGAWHYASQFTGKERDAETGLDYFGARYYSASIGRFMTPDWTSAASAVPYARFNNPQTLNLYSYARTNPITFLDLDGHIDGPSADVVEDPDHAKRQVDGPKDVKCAQGESCSAQNPTLTISTTPGATNNSGLSFPAGGSDIGSVTAEGRGWFYNVLLTGTLPEGTDASNYGIVQTFKDKTTGVTDDGKTFKANSSGKETVAPNGSWSTTRGNILNAVDSPGPHNTVGGKFVDSVTTNIQFKSWIVDATGKQVSPAVNWSVNIVVVGGQLKTATAGVE
ncbi:MAG TPA: RHS repeat-associated core domain-containing protein, partial [Terriglobales bacterium]|nr:RHS repeat-associated core domain-containing protein [Terriglobales bacterium]